ncbi:hypothetical protein [Salmonella enterica]|uniref:hypothetical protein n=1 Tax=Salmonella enterica TaxID=28901 RepID=UPI0011131987|nr:hypothetical protein [Salmonella enterica]
MFEEIKRVRTREESVKFVDFKNPALQPCSLAALQPCSLAALQPCSLAALQPCSLAGYGNLNYPNFPKYFPPDINFSRKKLVFADTAIQYPPVKQPASLRIC